MERRWYDNEPACTRLIIQLKGMQHPEIRDFAARIMIHFSERLRKALSSKDKLSSRVNSLGVGALTSLYKFGSYKRRWYDHAPELHKAIGQLYTLPHEGLSVIGFKLGDTFGLLQVYSAVCYQLGQLPAQKEMTKIALTALQSGKKEAEEALIAIVGRDLYEALSNHIERKNR
jgi:hypothetical protein